MADEDICTLCGIFKHRSVGTFNPNIENKKVDLCGKCSAEYQAGWRPEEEHIRPDVERFVREKFPFKLRELIQQREFFGAIRALWKVKKLYQYDNQKIKSINGLIEAVTSYSNIISRPSKEDYLQGAETAVGCSREEEIQELHRADVAPTRAEIDRLSTPYWSKIQGYLEKL